MNDIIPTNKDLIVLRASGLNATSAEAYGRATRTATTYNKRCEKKSSHWNRTGNL